MHARMPSICDLGYLMKRPFLLLLCAGCLTATVLAQSWCPTGAEWHWSLYGWAYDGYKHSVYTGDTVIGGLDAQKIVESGYGIDYVAMDTEAFSTTRYTASVESDVLLWVYLDSLWQWDTLYRFGASIGDIWRPAGNYETQTGCLVRVVDTATVSLAGIAIRQLTLETLQSDSTETGWSAGFLRERVGSEYGLWNLAYSCMMDGPYDYLRCYADDDMSYTAPDWHWGCDSYVGINAPERNPSMAVFPNPGSDHFTLDLAHGPHAIGVFDITGRKVLSQGVSGGSISIATQLLPSGTYLVQVDGARPVRWLKQ